MDETSPNLEEAAPSKPATQNEFSDPPLISATSGKVTKMSETVAAVEIKNSTPDDGDVQITATSHQSTGPAPQLQSNPEKSGKASSQTRRGCSSKVKPAPNLSQASRTRQPKSQPGTSSEATSAQSTSEKQNHCSSDTRLESSSENPSRESTDEAQLCDTGKSNINSDNLGTSDTAVAEIQRPSHSLPVQESSEHPVPAVTPGKDVPVSQKEGSEDAATQQTRRGRFQKVKPKPNITKTSRTALESPKAGKVESTHISSPERQVESCPASEFVPSIGEASALTSTEELSPTQEKSANSGVHRASENRLIPETTRDGSPTPESTEGKTVCGAETTETSTEPSPKTDSAPETSEHSAPPTAHNLQKEESEPAPTHPTGRSRFPKVKPKPNIALTSRTARSKAVNTKDTAEKDCNATPKPQIHEKTPVDAEEEPPSISLPEKLGQSTGSASDLMPCDLSTALTPTEQLSTSEEKKTSARVVAQVESSTVTSDQKSSEKQATGDTSPASESTEAKPMCLQTCDSTVPAKVGPESNRDSAPVQESSDHPASCTPQAEESHDSQKAESEVPSSGQNTRGKKIKPKPNLTRTSRAAQSKPQTSKDPVIHLQPEENPSSPTSRPASSDNLGAVREEQPTSHSTPPGGPSETSTGPATLLVPPLESCSSHKPAEESPSTEGQKTTKDVGTVSSSGGSEKNEPQRRQRFSKVKPNLTSYTRNKATKLQPSDRSKPPELCQMDISPKTSDQLCASPQPAETDSEHLTSSHSLSQTELKSSTKLGHVESVDSPNDKGTKSDGVVIATPSVAESVPALTDSVVEKRSSEKPTVEGESRRAMVTPGLASQWEYKQDMSIRATETNAQPMDDPTAILDVGLSGDGSADPSPEVKSADTQSTPNTKERTQQQSQDADQQSSEAAEAKPAAAQR